MVEKLQIEWVKISTLEVNSGQIEGVPTNPRFIKDSGFRALVQSISEDPDFMSANPLKVYKNVVIGGNMRLRACRELKWKEIPIVRFPDDTPPDILKARAIKDNHHYGEDDWDALANEWDDVPLNEWGVFKDHVTFNPNLSPETAQGQVTEADINHAQTELSNQFVSSEPQMFEIICPKCGNEFNVKVPSK
ncbi:MAG: hypothetical protein BWY95_00126 [Bacteroidetes bacterium ADurb.BinA104]|jgi:hypothetical protein|nr:MAG: hypothetical protein BWY95_00126 [Bacteroidetes bacterium ADurb.BinA104]